MPITTVLLTEMVTLRLLLAHMLGDYTLQTGKIARYKAQGWWGLLLHVAIVTTASGLLVAGMFPYWWLWILVLGLLHLFIDQLRTFHVRNIKAELSLFYLLFDQTLHFLTIVFIAWAGAQESPLEVWRLLIYSSDLGKLWPILVILLIFLVWTVAVLEMEAVRTLSSVCKIPPPREVLPLDRLIGANERLLAVALLISPFPGVYPAVFLPRLLWSLRHQAKRESVFACSVRTVVSMLSATGVGLLLMNIRPLS